MKNREAKIKNKEKVKTDKREILTRIMAGVLLSIMVVAACSTCIYYIVANV